MVCTNRGQSLSLVPRQQTKVDVAKRAVDAVLCADTIAQSVIAIRRSGPRV